MPTDLEISCDPGRLDVTLIHFVVPEFRGRGISKALMRAILAHPDLQTLRTFSLGTRDAHGLYARFGFEAIREPQRLMARYAP